MDSLTRSGDRPLDSKVRIHWAHPGHPCEYPWCYLIDNPAGTTPEMHARQIERAAVVPQRRA